MSSEDRGKGLLESQGLHAFSLQKQNAVPAAGGTPRGRDHWMACELDLGSHRLLSPSPVLGMYLLPAAPTLGAVPRAALRQ